MKRHLLFLCHRIPFPPNKGDKIRSFNILKKLAETYQIHLAAFVDDQDDWKYQNELEKYCEQTCLVNLDKRVSTVKSTTGFFSSKPLTLPYFFSKAISEFSYSVANEHPDLDIFVFSSSMAQYVQGKPFSGKRRVIDFVDVDSDKWKQYAQSKSWPMSWVYRRESRLLEKYEVLVNKEFDYSLFVSPQEARCFSELLESEFKRKVKAVVNGVDTEYFCQTADQAKDVPAISPFLVFTGAMDYWANVDAVKWFVTEVWQTLRQQRPELQFYIVGGHPTEEVMALAEISGVHVTGRVADVRPYILKSELAIAPMRIARGIQNKVLEAMSMQKLVVMTQMAADGILLPDSQKNFVCDSSADFCDAILLALSDKKLMTTVGRNNREKVESSYKWNATLRELEKVMAE